MDTSATTRLFPALIHHIEGIIAAIATVGGGWVILRQFLYTDRIFFLHPYEGGFRRIQHPMAQTNASQTLHNNQMGQECGFYMGITGGRRLFEALCPIFIILVHQKWGDCFTYFGWHPIECLGRYNN